MCACAEGPVAHHLDHGEKVDAVLGRRVAVHRHEVESTFQHGNGLVLVFALVDATRHDELLPADAPPQAVAVAAHPLLLNWRAHVRQIAILGGRPLANVRQIGILGGRPEHVLHFGHLLAQDGREMCSFMIGRQLAPGRMRAQAQVHARHAPLL